MGGPGPTFGPCEAANVAFLPSPWAPMWPSWSVLDPSWPFWARFCSQIGQKWAPEHPRPLPGPSELVVLRTKYVGWQDSTIFHPAHPKRFSEGPQGSKFTSLGNLLGSLWLQFGSIWAQVGPFRGPLPPPRPPESSPESPQTVRKLATRSPRTPKMSTRTPILDDFGSFWESF